MLAPACCGCYGGCAICTQSSHKKHCQCLLLCAKWYCICFVLGQWCFQHVLLNLTSKIDIRRDSKSGLPNLTNHQTMRQAAVVRTGRKAGPTRPMPTPTSRTTLAVRTTISSAVAAIRAVRAGIKARVSAVRATQVGSSHRSQEAKLAALSPGSRECHRRAGALTLIWGPWMTGIARDVIEWWAR